MNNQPKTIVSTRIGKCDKCGGKPMLLFTLDSINEENSSSSSMNIEKDIIECCVFGHIIPVKLPTK